MYILIMSKSSSTQSRKKRLKKIIIIGGAVLALLLAFVYVAPYVIGLLQSDNTQSDNYEDLRFFPVEEGKNVLEDELYLTMDREIYYTRYSETIALTEKSLESAHPAAQFFYSYFNCIKNGEHQLYSSFYTDDCYNHPNFNRPNSFTTQGLYDINIKLHSITVDEAANQATETYTVSYRIFENNGTYRKDVLPDELLVRVFEIKIDNGNIKICNVGFASKK